MTEAQELGYHQRAKEPGGLHQAGLGAPKAAEGCVLEEKDVSGDPECVLITSPLVRASPSFSLVPLLPTLVSVVGLCSSVCVSPRLSWLPGGPASLGSPEALPLWPETSNVPKLGSRLGSPHTPSSSHFPELASVPSCSSLLPRPEAPEGQEDGASSPRDPGGSASAQEPPQGVDRAWPCFPLLSLATPQVRGDLKVLLRLLLSCGHRCPHTLRKEALIVFSGS